MDQIKIDELYIDLDNDGEIALFELTLKDDEVRMVDERHYRLVPAERLDRHSVRDYRR